MLRPDSIDISPMYDVLTTTYWPYVDRSLSMSIGGAKGAVQITPHHWERLAKDNNLDPERVVQIARTVAGEVLANMDEAYRELPSEMVDVLREEIRKANRNVEPIYPVDQGDGGV
ncbi:hypothetical protein COO72_00745 [Bifidobacterium callitrichos]|nr:hypothetical protein COO72_00745 [Bifidobacterium callitrichos]